MATVQGVDSESLTRVLPLLRSHDPDIPDEEWLASFDAPWPSSQQGCGWMLLDGDEPVGFLGAVFADRVIDGRERSFCNLGTWYVRPDHRGSSLALLRPALALHDHTLTDLSASDDVVRILRKFDFDELDTRVRVLEPVPGRGLRRRVSLHLDDPSAAALLDAEERRVFSHHEGLPSCHRVVVSLEGGRSCLVVYTYHNRHSRAHAHVQYVSEADVFVENSSSILRAIRRWSGVKLVLADDRFTWARQIPRSRMLPDREVRLYRPCGDVEPADVDNLYSEMVLVDFALLPPSLVSSEASLVARGRRRLSRYRGRLRPATPRTGGK